jgi:Flp pilus assembly protein CpaB
MRSTKSIVLIVIALGCGLIASIGISQVMENRTASGGAVETETIYVAATNVPSYERLTAQVVQIEQWPKDKVPQGAARSLEDFEGMRPKVPLYPGEPILMNKLSDGTSGNASERIPEGMQVFAVKVDKESALSGLILPGDRVDVLVFIRGTSGRDTIQTGTRTILRNVSVFAVNDQIGRNTEEDGGSIDAKTVSLLVKPQQSERLLLAKQLGTIHLALRKPGDESNTETQGARPGDLDDSEQGAEWPSSQLASSGQTKPTSGIFDILNDMRGTVGPMVDTTSANASVQETVIMSPQGVMASYTFAHANSGHSRLPRLPRELLGSLGSTEPSPASEQSADSLQEGNDLGADDTVFPGDAPPLESEPGSTGGPNSD